jgi:hypothetical protein
MKNQNRSSDQPPFAIGTGLLALDDVRIDGDERPPRRWAGGTCGNVLLALRYLGWQTAPVARLRPGTAADRILDDLRTWGASTEFISLEADGSTPVIVHRIGRSTSGEPYHTFSWRCPTCGKRLPGYKPVLASTAREIASRLGSPQVFFFDRVSRGALLLAGEASARGAAVVFEPSFVGHPGLFREAWKLSDVVKFSHERSSRPSGARAFGTGATCRARPRGAGVAPRHSRPRTSRTPPGRATGARRGSFTRSWPAAPRRSPARPARGSARRFATVKRSPRGRAASRAQGAGCTAWSGLRSSSRSVGSSRAAAKATGCLNPRRQPLGHPSPASAPSARRPRPRGPGGI